MLIVIGTLAVTGGSFVLCRYLLELFTVAIARGFKGADLPVPNPMWGIVSAIVAAIGFALFFI